MVFSKNLYLSSDIKKGYRKYIRAIAQCYFFKQL